MKNGNYSDTKSKANSDNLQPPNKKRRIDTITRPQLATILPKEILIYILSFLQYSKDIILFSKTCKFFNQFINNNPSCIKHYRFGTREYNIQHTKLLNQIQKFISTNTNKSNMIQFFSKFSKLESLELHSMDPTLFHLLDIELDPTVIKLFTQHMLQPLKNKLTHLIVQTHDDSALAVNSFNFNNFKFENVSNVVIYGKDARYPFHITDYIPNTQQLTLVGLGLFPYSLFRMLFDKNKYMKHLLKFHVKTSRIVPATIPLRFYDSKLQQISEYIATYDISELYVNQNGGQLELIDFMWDHARTLGNGSLANFVLVMIFYNQMKLRSLRVNYEIFHDELELKHYGMKDWNGLQEFMGKYKRKQQINLPQLENLSISISRVASKDYKRLYSDLLFYKLNVPKLRSIDIIPGLMCWHNINGFIPFLEVLIGDQLYKLQSIKIINADKSDKTQQKYLESSIHSIQQIFQRRRQTIRIEY